MHCLAPLVERARGVSRRDDSVSGRHRVRYSQQERYAGGMERVDDFLVHGPEGTRLIRHDGAAGAACRFRDSAAIRRIRSTGAAITLAAMIGRPAR